MKVLRDKEERGRQRLVPVRPPRQPSRNNDGVLQRCSYRLAGSCDTNVVRRPFLMEGSAQASPTLPGSGYLWSGKAVVPQRHRPGLDLLMTWREQALEA